MKYLALIYSAPGTAPEYGSDAWGPFMAGYETATKTYLADGAHIAGEALQPVETATCVRIRNGKAELTDGPFAETKEQLGGFYLLDCADLDQAIRYAKLIPTAEHGTVEVRPVMEFDG
ncbi:YciI family protein [Actibacterium lipolyticum]|uniref:YCII-related domain protein n=1 Tax=Actibacterium lipolyticum TaxID=1524263 RepID=A0A238KID0_9RHOB|nr:YciI family protein [Actibacterium lipolyticum]SMX42639.1 YCII-related domain protein [Actibacterium lipolyticum]